MPPKLKKTEAKDDQSSASSIFKSLMATLSKEDRDLAGGPASNRLQIYFTIKDKPRVSKTRKDSLLEFAQKRERTYSQTVNFMSA